MSFTLPNLPVCEILTELADTLTQYDRVILQAATGAGKTTLVPLHLLQSMKPDDKILMLEPRRLAASAAATRMASLIGEPVGETVGYRMQLENRVSKNTKIEVVTEGILTRMLQDDPELSSVSILIFDEFHERSVQADLGLALSLQCQEYLREEPLKLLIMSATLQTEQLSQTINAPVITSKGFLHPVEEIYLDRPLPDRHFFTVCDHVCQLALRALKEQQGSILIFLPGAGEIRQLAKSLNEKNLPENTDVYPLYGDMSLAQQREAIAPSKAGRRKLVIATNIAETSLTIDGVTVVIDSGLTRKAVFDTSSGMTKLETRRTSLSSADQRKGRAGRLEPGTCYRLWTESEHQRLEKADAPEIMEADLSSLALDLCNWGATPEELFWLDKPPERRFQEALSLLKQLSAIEPTTTNSYKITEHGQKMTGLGAHPRIAHLLLESAKLGTLKQGSLLAAILTERDIIKGGNKQSADILDRIHLLESTGKSRGFARVHQLANRWQKQLTRQQKQQSGHTSYARLLMAAYPDRVAQRRGQTHQYLMNSGQGIELNMDDPLCGSEYLVVPAMGGASQRSNAKAFLACATDLSEIYDGFEHQIIDCTSTRWDSRLQRVISNREDRLGALILEQKPLQQPPSEAVSVAMQAGIIEAGLNVLPWTKESQQLRTRIGFLARFNGSDDEGFPDVSDTALCNSIENWLAPYLDGCTRYEHLKKLNLKEILLSMLSWPQQQLLNEQAPERLKVPSGSRILINYENLEEPKVSARLQELFGMLETPLIGFGKQPVTIELLSPAQRPVQITKDLKSFWNNTYSEVRKDLKGRYPKHYWPEDPMEAEATRFVRPRKS
ncbi:ATP-dependent helicase HrpB [Endozoicomonas sp. OPT23]|uniref:ATP-dependent helicase HrpB n=1 Tax=Endozoicomonas sp. OPT23 TaxID=2072845 RepID=UPI00129B074B|nr:ATP-dependent helicase HrpB [Endozoicomonas sp. OPT23]MRI33587.1 ATP-dependent helicase HrpB [Endozoicomonas sp. OPT23]